MAETQEPKTVGEEPNDLKVRWADRIALQTWIILFLLTLCVALIKFLIGF